MKNRKIKWGILLLVHLGLGTWCWTARSQTATTSAPTPRQWEKQDNDTKSTRSKKLQQPAGLVITIKRPQTFHVLPPHYYGMNSLYIAARDHTGNFMSSQMQKMITLTGIRRFRYPGGTLGNFFNWKSSTLEANWIQQAGKKKLLKTISRQKSQNNGKLSKGNFDSWVQVGQAQNLAGVIVLPVLFQSAQQCIALVDKIKKKMPEVVFWEMGNELAFYNYRFKLTIPGGWNEKKYRSRFVKIAQHIRKQYPADQISICVNGIHHFWRFKVISDKINTKLQPWDSEMARSEVRPYYDGVTYHPYIVPEPDEIWQKHFFKVEKMTAEQKSQLPQLKYKWIFSQVQDLPGRLSVFADKTFPGKRLWLTELGLLDKGGTHELNPYTSSIIGALFHPAYFISWLSQPSLPKMYMPHLLLNGSGKSSTCAMYKDYSWNANTLGFTMIKRALEGSTYVSPLLFPESPTYSGIKPFDKPVRALSGLYLSGETGDKILLVNTGKVSLDISVPFAQGRVEFVSGTLSIRIMPGKINAFSDFGKSGKIGKKWQMPPLCVGLIYASH